MSYFNHSNSSIITLDGNGNSTLIEDSTSNPYDENVMNGLIYFLVSLLFGFPILMVLLCVYRMRGDPPSCNVKKCVVVNFVRLVTQVSQPLQYLARNSRFHLQLVLILILIQKENREETQEEIQNHPHLHTTWKQLAQQCPPASFAPLHTVPHPFLIRRSFQATQAPIYTHPRLSRDRRLSTCLLIQVQKSSSLPNICSFQTRFSRLFFLVLGVFVLVSLRFRNHALNVVF